jgi:hypothetical protein
MFNEDGFIKRITEKPKDVPQESELLTYEFPTPLKKQRYIQQSI